MTARPQARSDLLFQIEDGCVVARLLSIHLGLQEHVNDDIFIHITKPDGTEAIVPRAAQITLETVRWESKPAAFLFPDDFLRQRRFNYRIPLIKTTDALHRFFVR